jgi:four helix bundle protein
MEGIMTRLVELEVYILSEKLSDKIWCDFDQWPIKVQRTIGYQIIRSSDSIAANISEGYGRFTPADRKVFYRYARGSFEETNTWLRKLIRRRIVNQDDIKEYELIINALGPKLNAFISSTK